MSKRKKLIPILSLSALLVTSALSMSTRHYYNGLLPKEYFTSDAIFTDEETSNSYESSLNSTLINSLFVPQGLTFNEDFSFISFYDYSSINKSIIKVFTHDGRLVNTFTLPNRGHVGGISYDYNNNLLWVASTYGTVDAYRVNDVICNDKFIPYYSKLDLGKGLPSYANPLNNSISYMTIYKDQLFVGNFQLFQKCTVKRYKISIDSQQNVNLEFLGSFLVPDRVQGLTIYEKDADAYLLLSRSFGNGESSSLQIYKYFDYVKDYTNPLLVSKCFKFPAMMEQVETFDDKLYSLYEYESKIYGGSKEDEYVLRVSKIDEIIRHFS